MWIEGWGYDESKLAERRKLTAHDLDEVSTTQFVRRSNAPFDRVGLISPGYEGSFIVLDRDIFTVPASEIDHVRVKETYIQGDRCITVPDPLIQ